jgi:hypothetical protein
MKTTFQLSENPYQFQKLSASGEIHSHIALVENNLVLVVIGDGLGELASNVKRVIYQTTTNHLSHDIILSNPVEIPWRLIKYKLGKNSPAEVIQGWGLENIHQILTLENSLEHSH